MYAGIFTFVTTFTNWLNEFASHWWFLGIIAPVVPSETTVIIGGVVSAQQNSPYPLIGVIAAGAIGAFLGDHTAYFAGNKMSPWFTKRAAKNPKFKKKLDWAAAQIEERGGLLLITGRFIPGGRTILTLSSGITKQPLPWFTRWISIAVVIWASYAAILGRIGGQSFKDNHSKAFLFAFGLAISATVIIEVVRHFVKKKNSNHA
jgi:membrane-associated protein